MAGLEADEHGELPSPEAKPRSVAWKFFGFLGMWLKAGGLVSSAHTREATG